MTTGPHHHTGPPGVGAAQQWAALAGRLAARGRMRVSRDGGKSYPRRGERDAGVELPNQPAAVLLYDVQGCAPVFVVDLDTSRGGVEAVDRDFRSLSAILSRVGASWFADSSPNGGRHVYVPLAQPVPFAEARAIAAAVATRFPTADPLPMLGLSEGCIRPPGARHRSGGHQALSGPLSAAEAALDTPTTPSAWRTLTAAFPHTGRATEPSSEHSSVPEPPEAPLEALHGHPEPDASYQAIARTGVYDPDRYATPSEARQAVIWACVAAGWALVDVTCRLHDGTWPGLASLYARYSLTQRHTALARDWRAAHHFEKQRRQRSRSKPVRLCTTSPQQTQGRWVQGGPATVNQAVREWLTTVDLLCGEDRPFGVAERVVLYALAQAAVLTGSLEIEHGNRSLAIATGLDPSTISRVLRRLLAEPDDRAVVDLIREARGVRAHTWRLVVPDQLQQAASAKPWRRGRIHAIRPAFRELGATAAFTYVALEQRDSPTSGRELAGHARLGVTATAEALQVLHAWGLVERTPQGWLLSPGAADRLTDLAEMWGLAEAITVQIQRYRDERRAWRRRLGLVEDDHQVRVLHADRAPPSSTSPPGGAPPDPEQLIRDLLGGTRIA